MKKRCIFLVLPNLWGGGQARFASRLTTILKENYDLKLILFNGKDIVYPIDCEYFSLDNLDIKVDDINKYLLIAKRLVRLRKLMRKHRPQVSVSFGNVANIVNIFAGIQKCKTMVSIRGYESVNKFNKNRIKAMLFRFLIKRSSKIICVSQVMAEEMKQILSLGEDRVRVLYNAFDMEEIKRLSKQETELDPWFAENKVIVTVGAFRHEKGYWHLLKALSLAKSKDAGIKLLHIGPDYREHGKNTEKLIRDLGLEEDVVLLGFQENPYKYCAKSKAFVLSSVSEGFPNALVEAMACGIPVIAADCKTGPREILMNVSDREVIDSFQFADHGILVPTLNLVENYDPRVIEKGEEILAEAIYHLLNDQPLAEAYSAKAEQRAADFSYEKCREQMIQILES